MREAFPFFRHHPDLIYLDSAATAHKPACVIEAIQRFYERDYATVHRAAYKNALRATDLYHQARETAVRFLGARSTEEIVFTRGTTDSINLVAKRFPFQPGDEILLSQLEHHSNLVPWQMIAQEKRLSLAWIKVLPTGELDLEHAPFSRHTKLVAITHVSNVTGTVTPLKRLIEQARSYGAAVLVDGAQAAPHLPLNMQALDADFYAFSGHKCYGPTGIGVLYGKRERLEMLGPWAGGGDMVERVEWDHATYQKPPLRFEAGTPSIAATIGLGAALSFLEQLNRSQVLELEQSLLQLATERLQEIRGLRILGTAVEKGPLVTFTLKGIHSLDLATLLDCKGIAIRSGHLCAQPLLRHFGLESVVRASFALYNTEKEIEQFTEAVHSIAKAYSL